MDAFTKSQRSRIMAAVKSRDTVPEMIVRRVVRELGYQYRLHRRDLPGTPDIVLVRSHKIINIHGCFWHMHFCQRRRKNPVHNAKYWSRKLEGNFVRDRHNFRKLRAAGWSVLTVWECQTRDVKKLLQRIEKFLSS